MRLLLSLLLSSALCVYGYGRDLGQVAENSTSNELKPKGSSLSAELSLSSLSSLLVERLKLRVQQSDESLQSFKKVVEAMNDYEAKWKLSEASLAQLQTDHKETLRSHSDLIQRFDNYLRASEERAEADANKIRQLEHNMMKTAALWAAGGVVVGVVMGLLL